MQIKLENEAQIKILLFLVKDRIKKNIFNINNTDDILLQEYYFNQKQELDKIEEQLENCHE